MEVLVTVWKNEMDGGGSQQLEVLVTVWKIEMDGGSQQLEVKVKNEITYLK